MPITIRADDAADLARLDDDGGPNVAATRSVVDNVDNSSVRRRLIPGERQPGMLTTLGAPPPLTQYAPYVPGTDAATADWQREGGGAPSQRRPMRDRTWGKRLEGALRQFVTMASPGRAWLRRVQ